MKQGDYLPSGAAMSEQIFYFILAFCLLSESEQSEILDIIMQIEPEAILHLK